MVGSHYLQKQNFSGQKPCYEDFFFFFSKIQIFHSRVLYRSGHSVGLTESDVDSVSRFFFFFFL